VLWSPSSSTSGGSGHTEWTPGLVWPAR
jgi:hypothetical protein